MGSANRIADAAILVDILILDILSGRFTGSAGGGHIKVPWLIRTPLRLSLLFIPF